MLYLWLLLLATEGEIWKEITVAPVSAALPIPCKGSSFVKECAMLPRSTALPLHFFSAKQAVAARGRSYPLHDLFWEELLPTRSHGLCRSYYIIMSNVSLPPVHRLFRFVKQQEEQG